MTLMPECCDSEVSTFSLVIDSSVAASQVPCVLTVIVDVHMNMWNTQCLYGLHLGSQFSSHFPTV